MLDVLNITIAHHKGFRHVHHGLLGKIMSHLGDESSPPKKKDLLFLQCHGQCFGYVACVGKCIKQLLKRKARHIHNHLASVEFYFKWAEIFFEGNAKLTYRTLQGLGTSAHTTHFHVAWMIDGKLDS